MKVVSCTSTSTPPKVFRLGLMPPGWGLHVHLCAASLLNRCTILYSSSTEIFVEAIHRNVCTDRIYKYMRAMIAADLPMPHLAKGKIQSTEQHWLSAEHDCDPLTYAPWMYARDYFRFQINFHNICVTSRMLSEACKPISNPSTRHRLNSMCLANKSNIVREHDQDLSTRIV